MFRNRFKLPRIITTLGTMMSFEAHPTRNLVRLEISTINSRIRSPSFINIQTDDPLKHLLRQVSKSPLARFSEFPRELSFGKKKHCDPSEDRFR